MGAVNRAASAVKYIRDKIVAASTDASSRVYTGSAPQSASYPMVVMDIVSGTDTESQDTGSELSTFRIQVDMWAKNTAAASGFDTVTNLDEAVRAAISRQVGTEGAIIIDGIQQVNYLTDFIPEIEVYRVMRDYMIRVK